MANSRQQPRQGSPTKEGGDSGAREGSNQQQGDEDEDVRRSSGENEELDLDPENERPARSEELSEDDDGE